MKKYEITDIQHPKYPWLHRIRALYSFREDVQQGQLGGFVQGEDNLSQDGTCWLFDDAIAFQSAYVSQQATMRNHARAQGGSLVSGTAICEDNSLVSDNAIVTDGILTDSCFVGGNANIHANPQTGVCPKLSSGATVYGEVSGYVDCCGYSVVLPGMALNNPTIDKISISHLGVKVSVAWNHPSRNILPPDFDTYLGPVTTDPRRQAQPHQNSDQRDDAR